MTADNKNQALCKMILSQKERHVEGMVRVSTVDKAYYAVYKIEGNVSGNVFKFAGTTFVESISPPDFNWCLPAGEFRYSGPEGMSTLTGTWGANNDVAGGCPEGVKGDAKLSR